MFASSPGARIGSQCVCVVSSGQNTAIGVGVAVGVGVTPNVAVGNDEIDTELLCVVTPPISTELVEVAMTAVLVGVGNKLRTADPLEQITNMLSATFSEGLVSKEKRSTTLGSPQSKRFPDNML